MFLYFWANTELDSATNIIWGYVQGQYAPTTRNQIAARLKLGRDTVTRSLKILEGEYLERGVAGEWRRIPEAKMPGRRLAMSSTLLESTIPASWKISLGLSQAEGGITKNAVHRIFPLISRSTAGRALSEGSTSGPVRGPSQVRSPDSRWTPPGPEVDPYRTRGGPLPDLRWTLPNPYLVQKKQSIMNEEMFLLLKGSPMHTSMPDRETLIKQAITEMIKLGWTVKMLEWAMSRSQKCSNPGAWLKKTLSQPPIDGAKEMEQAHVNRIRDSERTLRRRAEEEKADHQVQAELGEMKTEAMALWETTHSAPPQRPDNLRGLQAVDFKLGLQGFNALLSNEPENVKSWKALRDMLLRYQRPVARKAQ